MDIRTLLLKAGATALTVAATVASAAYVTAHVKNPQAPLQPAVLTGTLTLGPSVRPAPVTPVTSTYAS